MRLATSLVGVTLVAAGVTIEAAEDILVADFEERDYGDWQVTGAAFGPGPARGTLPRQMRVSGFLGKGLVNTFFKGDGSTGTLTSPPLVIQRRYINFLVGGGRHPGETCMNLVVDGNPVRTVSGPNDRPGGNERLTWCAWDVGQFIGKTARIRIIDEHRGGWGHINVDHIYQSDVAKAKRVIDAYDGDLLIADFEGPTYGGWRATGDAFGSRPCRASEARQRRLAGFRGQGLVNSMGKGNRRTGTLTSPAFTIQRPTISFRVGGGNWPGMTCVDLVVDGDVVRSSSGSDQEALAAAAWDVADLKGKTARIRIVDAHRGLWGNVLADHFVQSNTPRAAHVQGDPEAARRRALAALEEHGVEEIVFALRQEDPDGHWYANFSTWSSNPKRKLYHNGGRLCRLNLKTGEVTHLIDDPKGGVRDPQVHYDGGTILFSYRKGGQPFYHLYEINVDGTELRRLTDGPFDDIEPTYLPDGGIIFCSSRANRMVNCYYVRVAVLYRCDGDGGNVRCLSANIEQDNTPWVLSDGRVLYQRWEYIDRSQVSFHHLWSMYPDGTNQMVYFGNMNPSTVMIDAKPIPGTGKVVASFSPGHGRREHAGTITVVDPRKGPDERPFARALHRGRWYRDPYPLSEDCFLVAGSTDILVMDGQGQVGRVYDLSSDDKLAGLRLHEPRPLVPRPRERVIAPRVDPTRKTGRLFLADVRRGRNMAGVKPGEIKTLLVLEALPKPVNFTGGWEPITYGGSFTLERILGTVPVEPDGSACFDVPAVRSLFFVALDADGMAVKRMQSFVTVEPGETFGCVGCHEHRAQTPPPGRPRVAMRRPPSRIQPIADVPDLFDFPRDIQPILDTHCVACHGYEATPQGGPRAGGVILTGDRGPTYSHSYVMLTLGGQISDGRNLARGNSPPRALGSSASPLMDKLRGDHYDVRLSKHEMKMIRLWIDTAAAYPGTYAALGSGMVGARGWGKRTQMVLDNRCGSCHTRGRSLPASPRDTFGMATSGRITCADPRLRTSCHIVYNLTRPAKSLVLLAPLAKTAGGYGLCQPVSKGQSKTAAVFATTHDPDYRTLLEAIEASKKQLDRIKRFDMAGFRPNRHYIREMKFYGILPPDTSDDAPIDVYQTDRAYWKSLWYRPLGEVISHQ